GPKGGIGLPQPDPEHADRERGCKTGCQEPQLGREADEDRAGGAGEADLGQTMDGEPHVSGRDKRADEAGDDRRHGPGHQRLLHEGIVPQAHPITSSCAASTGSCPPSSAPTTKTRPRWRSTSTGSPYTRLRVSDVRISSGEPAAHLAPASRRMRSTADSSGLMSCVTKITVAPRVRFQSAITCTITCW